MDGALKKGVGLLVILFLGFWLVQDPNGLANSVQNAGNAIWDVLVDAVQQPARVLPVHRQLRLSPWGRLKRMTEPDIGRHLLRDEGEDIVDIVRKHWVVYIVPMLIGYLAPGRARGVPVLQPRDRVGPRSWSGFVLLRWGGFRALARHLDRFVITNMRVFRDPWRAQPHRATMPLGASSTSPWTSRCRAGILNYGHFTFESAAQSQGLQQISYVARPTSAT